MFNQCTFIGNLGSDPEIRSFSNGGQVANVSIACTEKWRSRQTGERKEHTEWVRLSFGGKLAEIVQQHLRKGDRILAQGKLRTRKWQGQDGQDRYSTEIRVEQMQMLGGRQDGGPAPSQPPAQSPAPAPSQGGFGDMDDEIPF